MAIDLKFILGLDDQSGPAFNNAKKNVESLGNSAAMSAKQTEAALRMVPAQMTDIVVSLQSGQSPLTVLLQQGGQLKDMFGGAVPAAKALGTYIFSLINPLSLAAAGAAALAVAYYQGSQEGGEFNKQIALTGNVAGVSSSQLVLMAASQAKVSGTQREAAEVLAMLVGTGKVAAEQFGVITSAALGMADATGQPIKEIVSDFAALGDEPVKASERLNAAHHYLTQRVYEQIKALEDQGEKSSAAALAQTTYAAAMEKSSNQITENLGALGRSFKWVGDVAKSAWDSILGVGRDLTGAEQLSKLKKQLADKEAAGPVNSLASDAHEKGKAALRSEIALLERLNSERDASAKREGERQRAEDSAVGATAKVSALGDRAKGVSAVTKALEEYRKEREAIAKVNPNSEFLDPKVVAAGIAQIKKEHQGRQVKPTEAPINADIANLRGQYEAEERALKQSLTTMKADYDIGLLTARNYLDRQFEAKANSLQRELALAQKQEELARGKKNVAAVERYSSDVKRITDEIASTWVNHSLVVDQLSAKVQRAVRAYQDSLDAAYNTRQQGMDDQLQGAGLGQRALEELQRMTTLRREVDKRREELRRDNQKGEEHGGIGDEQYAAELADLQQYFTDRIGQETDFNVKAKALRMDWTVGANQAVANYLESAQDIAGQMNRTWTNAFGGMEDALVTFAKTGKLNFKSLADSVITDMIRMELRAKASALMSSSGGGSSGLGLLSSVAGLFGAGASMGLGDSLGMSMNGTYGAKTQAGLDGLVSKFVASAKGNVFSSPGLHDYANTVVSKPTTFAFAKGAGLMGEAGPEAIMPLTRGMDGRLGVAAIASGGAGSVGGGGNSMPAITLVNQTTGRIDKVEQRRMSDDELVVVMQQIGADSRSGAYHDVASGFADPSSKVSRGVSKGFRLNRPR